MSPCLASSRCLLALGAAALLSACVGSRTLADPTLEIRTRGGSELGVSTDYGVVFLGSTAAAGRAELTAWFGDGPSIEPVVIEPIGGGLYTAETEIRLPSVPMSFEEPRPGQILIVIGRDASVLWQTEARVADEPRALGILLNVPGELRRRSGQTGAGVYLVDPEDEHNKRLVGLISGLVTFTTPTGTREYLTVVGPHDLWRLVTHRREQVKKKRWVYREDIL